MKKIITLYLEEDVKNKAKELGVNLSSFLERKLQEYIRINDPEYARVVGLNNVNYAGMTVSIPSDNVLHLVPAFFKHKKDYENC